MWSYSISPVWGGVRYISVSCHGIRKMNSYLTQINNDLPKSLTATPNFQIDAILPDCNHMVNKPCHKPVKNYPCSHPCEVRLPCGHTCTLTCHMNNDPDHLEVQCIHIFQLRCVYMGVSE